VRDLIGTLVGFGDHFPEFLKLILLQGVVHVEKAVEIAGDFEVEDI